MRSLDFVRPVKLTRVAIERDHVTLIFTLRKRRYSYRQIASIELRNYPTVGLAAVFLTLTDGKVIALDLLRDSVGLFRTLHAAWQAARAN